MKLNANEIVFMPGSADIGGSDCLPLEDGRVLAVWECGGVIMGALRDSKGRWEETRKITPNDAAIRVQPRLHNADGGIMLFCGVRSNGTVVTAGAAGAAEFMMSADGGISFSAPAALTDADREPIPALGRILKLADGALIAGGNAPDADNAVYVYRSDDGGEVWRKTARINLSLQGGDADYTGADGGNRRLGSPVFWSEGGGYVRALFRSASGFVLRADSLDGGETWNTPYSLNVANPNSPLDVLSLPSIESYMVCNQTGLPEGKSEGKRTPLNLLYSNTNGSTWKKLTALATGKGEFTEPSMRHFGGRIYITYTWNRLTVQFVIVEL